jgi:hypothetical protein
VCIPESPARKVRIEVRYVMRANAALIPRNLRAIVIDIVCLEVRSQERLASLVNRLRGTLGTCDLILSAISFKKLKIKSVDVDVPEKSGLSLSRLVPGAGRKSSGRPSTADGTSHGASSTLTADTGSTKRDSRDSGASKERKDPSLLRKRTSSTTSPTAARGDAGDRKPNVGTTLKAGQSILQQIGAPDHNGWLRKKGDRYNTWKNRYFVLKGPHLYWLRSNSTTVSFFYIVCVHLVGIVFHRLMILTICP